MIRILKRFHFVRFFCVVSFFIQGCGDSDKWDGEWDGKEYEYYEYKEEEPENSFSDSFQTETSTGSLPSKLAFTGSFVCDYDFEEIDKRLANGDNFRIIPTDANLHQLISLKKIKSLDLSQNQDKKFYAALETQIYRDYEGLRDLENDLKSADLHSKRQEQDLAALQQSLRKKRSEKSRRESIVENLFQAAETQLTAFERKLKSDAKFAEGFKKWQNARIFIINGKTYENEPAAIQFKKISKDGPPTSSSSYFSPKEMRLAIKSARRAKRRELELLGPRDNFSNAISRMEKDEKTYKTALAKHTQERDEAKEKLTQLQKERDSTYKEKTKELIEKAHQESVMESSKVILTMDYQHHITENNELETAAYNNFELAYGVASTINTASLGKVEVSKYDRTLVITLKENQGARRYSKNSLASTFSSLMNTLSLNSMADGQTFGVKNSLNIKEGTKLVLEPIDGQDNLYRATHTGKLTRFCNSELTLVKSITFVLEIDVSDNSSPHF